MSILDLLGLDPEEFRWQDLALCKGTNRKWFYEQYETDPVKARQIDEMCLSCPVIKQCLDQGRENEWGVWGGIYWDGSGKPDKNKNAHKTEEDWNRLREALDGQ